ncbi:hypothetical protein H6P81_004575 [Aristolochia fimbriata]|uniref:Uncharacterized protein n=1 Tax=Aristolochia fimbriata TaxID=158543 RepID=A0AAV7ET80_ARIFI|nr:hypothetical protein H6P81_004575 [Aristolochia fimbriata]
MRTRLVQPFILSTRSDSGFNFECRYQSYWMRTDGGSVNEDWHTHFIHLCSIYRLHDEAKDKAFELELSCVCDKLDDNTKRFQMMCWKRQGRR